MTRIPAPTARRYATLFKDFLCGTKVGRVTKYPEESVQVFNRISQLYSEGRVTHEIEEILRGELPRTVEVEGSQPAPCVPSPSAQSGELAQSFSDIMERVADCMETMADQRRLIERQQEDVQKLKTAFVMLARSQKRLKELPQAEPLPQDVLESWQRLEEKDRELEETAMSLSLDTSDIKAKLQTLESELVRLRRDRRDMEKHLQEKIERLKSDLNS